MRRRTHTYKWVAFFAISLFVGVYYFTVGFGVPFAGETKAAAVTWVGGATGNWNVASNWSGGTIPTVTDDVTISSTTGDILVTVQSGQTAIFNTLTIGGDATYYATTTLIGNVNTTGAATGSITIDSKGILQQENNTEQTIDGALSVNSGGLLTHTTNDSAHSYSVYFNVGSLTMTANSSINVDANGYGEASGGGDGPSGATFGNGGSFLVGGGGGHMGKGGIGYPTSNPITTGSGGVGYCDITGPTTIGSEGASGTTETGGDGGGLIRISVSGTASINGELSADGESPAGDAGGGAGGAINISADTFSGTPSSISAIGGSADSVGSDAGAGGGGGCVLLTYTTASSIDGLDVDVYGGSGQYYGGAGIAYIKPTGGNGDFFAVNNGNNGNDPGETEQLVNSVTLGSLTIASSTFYSVTSTRTLVLTDSDPFTNGNASGTLKILDTATFTPPTSFTISSSTLIVSSTATLTSASSINLTVEDGGTFEMSGYTTTSPLTLATLTVNNRGTLTHSENDVDQDHVVNISATTISINAGATIDVDGRGYFGGDGIGDGYGPGAGINQDGANQYGSGGGHGGAGGDDSTGDTGGSAYCVAANPGTLGSGGGGNFDGGDGGGFVKLNASGTLTIAGTITADGDDAPSSGVTYYPGGGAGGGVHLTGSTVTLDNGTIGADGGASTGSAVNGGGAGGGGCVYVSYGSISDTGATTSTAAGTGGYTGGTSATAGLWTIEAQNAQPSAIAPFAPVQGVDGNGYVTVTTTVSDADDETVELYVDFSSDGGVTWSSSTIASLTAGSGSPTTSTGKIESITDTAAGNALTFTIDLSSTWVTSTQASVRLVPDDSNAQGTSVTSTGFIVDTIEPYKPGNLDLSVSRTDSVDLSLGSAADDDNFKEYKIFYKQGQSGVTESDIAFTSSTDSNLGSVSFNGASSVTIEGLDGNTQYVAQLYAYDDYGFSTTSASELTFSTAIGGGLATTKDRDGDSWANDEDNCPNVYNKNQEDTDRNGVGDACEADQDEDGIGDENDNCPLVPNGIQLDDDLDGIGDKCEPDSDKDDYADDYDNCPNVANPDQKDDDKDGIGDACDKGDDTDGDGVHDSFDVCPRIKNPDQKDGDKDGIGDVCEDANAKAYQVKIFGDVTRDDYDKDYIEDAKDSCPRVYNINNKDSDGDGIGDVCDIDADNDEVFDEVDNCPKTKNKDQKDVDGDGVGDACSTDADNDGVFDDLDNCKDVVNPSQEDIDSDGEGDACDKDKDGDETVNELDNCPVDFNRLQQDADKDGIGDACDPNTDTDKDGIPDNEDNCKLNKNPDQADADKNGIGDACEPLRQPVKKPDPVVPPAQQIKKTDTPLPPGETPIESAPLSEVGIKIIRDGSPVKVTNNRSVNVQLDTSGGYSYVTLRDNGGQVKERVPLSAADNWEFTEGDGEKCLTAQFFDARGNLVREKVSCFILDTTPPEPPPLSVSAKVIVEDVFVGNEITIRGTTEPNTTLIIRAIRTGNLPSEEVAASLNPFRAFVAHAAAGSFKTRSDNEGFWSFTFPEVFDLGLYTIQVQAEDEAGNISAPASIDIIVRDPTLFEQALQLITDFINNPRVEQLNERVVAPAVVVIGGANFVATGFQLPQVFVFLKYLFLQPILFFRRKKHKTWGTVYNGFTKAPIDLATVRIIDAETGGVKRSQVTDAQGRYFLMGMPGSYRIEVDKAGFGGISKHLGELDVDGEYTRVYHGEELSVDAAQIEVNFSIPVDPEGKEEAPKKIIRKGMFRAVQHVISLVGFGATGLSFVISPTPMVGGFLVVHGVFYVISHKFSKPKLPKTVGTITDKKSGDPLKNVVVRVIDNAYHKLIETKLTNAKGQYAMLVGPSTYYLTFEKPGYERKQTKEMDYAKEGGGLIAIDELLMEGGKPLSEEQKAQLHKEREEARQAAAAHIAKRKEEGEAGEATGEHTDPEALIAQWKQDNGQHQAAELQSQQTKSASVEEDKDDEPPAPAPPAEPAAQDIDEDDDFNDFINNIKTMVL